jgi:diaminopimelate epimerase
MGAPVFALEGIPFDDRGIAPVMQGAWDLWPVALTATPTQLGVPELVLLAPVSMGNPHGVLRVDDVDAAPVALLGPAVQASTRFTQGVNVGFMQVVDRSHIRLRVYERGVGETLACGSGACAAVVAGIRLGLLDSQVDVQTHGGTLTIEWNGGTTPVLMTGPAVTVFQGEIELPDTL